MVGKRAHRGIPPVNRLVTRAAGGAVRVDRSDRCFASRRLVHFTEMEYAVPRAAAADLLRGALAVVEERRLPVNFPFELRVVAGDDAFLSPAHGRDTAYVAVHAYRGMPWGWFRDVERVAMELGGRPHWGKRHFQTAATLAPRYPEWDRFQAVRARLDPEGVFQNAYTERVLGPVGEPAALTGTSGPRHGTSAPSR
jgi:L-gulonolactone oxidase